METVKIQTFHLKRCLDTGKLMDALKYCSTMLAELRTSSLNPKNYYELYMAIFDQLTLLSAFLYENHKNNNHHLSDLYELVQYAGNIVPRLYLMITAGAIYMKVSKESIKPPSSDPAKHGLQSMDNQSTTNSAPGTDDVPPIKELMKDMLEMSRGCVSSIQFFRVQHPTRGLFLRYYLSVMTRDYLPDGIVEGFVQKIDNRPHGTIHDSIFFILQNFIEMNKLWVRLQHQGHSREKEKREQERRELRLLVGSNLVRLSQLDALDLKIYSSTVLPSILEEIVSCKDVIAQDYLMEVIIQVFPDDFHLRTLDPFLSATAQLHRNVNVKQIVISLIDRFASYASRATSSSPISETDSIKSNSGQIPEDVKLFDVFWFQITELVKARPEFSIQYIIALLGSLINLSLNCYPTHLEYVDNVLGFAKIKVLEAKVTISDAESTTSLLSLLLSPINSYRINLVKNLLEFPSSSLISKSSTCLGGNYSELLYLQPYSTRRQISHALASTLLDSGVKLTSVDGVNMVFGELLSCMIRDQVDGNLSGRPDENYEWSDIIREQELIAKLVHLVGGNVSLASSLSPTTTTTAALKIEDQIIELGYTESDIDEEFKLIDAARNHFGEGGEIRIRFTLPPLGVACIKLARKYHQVRERSKLSHDASSITPKLQALYKFFHVTVSTLLRAREYFAEDESPLFGEIEGTGGIKPRDASFGGGLMSPPEMALRLFLMGAKSADETDSEELAYEFFVQAFTIYEESISESKAQTRAITLIIGTLQTCIVFGYENYETLTTKCAVHCSRLLKRVDQCRMTILVSHLFLSDTSIERSENKPGYRNGKRVLECMQKALKIADSVMDRDVSVQLFVEVLERCIWFYEKQITIKYINSLIDLIQTNLASIPAATNHSTNLASMSGAYTSEMSPITNAFASASLFAGNESKNVGGSIVKHFQNVLASIAFKRDNEAGSFGEKALWVDVSGI